LRQSDIVDDEIINKINSRASGGYLSAAHAIKICEEYNLGVQITAYNDGGEGEILRMGRSGGALF
jgi:hypothetical protein